MANVFQVTRKLIEAQFNTYWSALDPTPTHGVIPWRKENTNFNQPANSKWIRTKIIWGKGVQGSLGSLPREFQPGTFVVQIFTPKNTGSGDAHLISDLVAAGLRFGQLKGDGVVVDFQAPEKTDVPERDDFFQSNVWIDFRAKHITAVAVRQ